MNMALFLEGKVAYQVRKKLSRMLFALMCLFISLSITTIILEMPFIIIAFFQVSFLISMSLFIANNALRYWFRREYQNLMKKRKGISVEAGMVYEKGERRKDHVEGLIASPYGHHVLKRLGLSDISIQDFLHTKQTKLPQVEIKSGWHDLSSHVSAVHDNNDEFAEFLRNHRITRDDLAHAGHMVEDFSSSRYGVTPSSFYKKILNNEHKKGVMFTAQAIRALAYMPYSDALHILDKISEYAKHKPSKMIYISDINSHELI